MHRRRGGHRLPGKPLVERPGLVLGVIRRRLSERTAPAMKWHERLQMVRRYGPPSPTLRHVLEVLASYDSEDGGTVWPSVKTLAGSTGYKERCIRSSLGKLVRCGWLAPEKPTRESRPADAAGREAWWAHGNLGGRKNSTRYRVVYRTETLHQEPEQPGTRNRVPKTGEAKTLHQEPLTLHQEPINPAPGTGDPLDIHKEPRGGDTPPTPPPGDAGDEASPHGAGAPVWPLDTRHAIQATLKRQGAEIHSTQALEAWEGIMARIGVESEQQVTRVLFDLAMWYQVEFSRPLLMPYPAADLAPFAKYAAKQLDARKTLDHRLAQRATA